MGWIFRPPHPLRSQSTPRGKFPFSNPRAKIETLTDDYNDNSLDGAKWSSFVNSGATLAETTQQIVITVDNSASSVYAGLDAVNTYKLYESSVSVKIASYPTQSANTQIYLLLQDPTGGAVGLNNRIFMDSINGTWYAKYRDNAGSNTIHGTYVGTPSYVKISHSAGVVHWWWSNDGSSWTEIGTGVAFDKPWLGSCFIELAFGHFASDISSNTIKFDDFNVISAVNYTQTNTGTITPAGALVKLTRKTLVGTITPAGALTLLRVIPRAYAGTITPAGALAKRVTKVLAGTVTPAGALAKLVGKLLAGTITPAGALAKRTSKTMGGTLTPTGVLTLVQATDPLHPRYTGTITPAGVLKLKVNKGFSSSITPTGRLCKKWPFPTWTNVSDGSLTATAVNDASLTFSTVSDASLSLSAVSDASLTLTGVTDTSLTPTVVPEECS